MRTKTMGRGAALILAGAMVTAPPVEAQQIQWSGSVWTRFEARDLDEGPNSEFTWMQTRLGAARALGPNLRFFAQFQDARRWGEESGTLDGDAEAFDLHQGYFEVGQRGSSTLWARVGRQEVEYGNGRLVGTPEWTVTNRSFDGVRGTVALADDARLDLFGFQTREDAAAGIPADESFWGAWTEFGLGADRMLNLFALHDRGDGVVETERTTVGTEYSASEGVVNYRVEAAVQVGTVADQELSGANLLAGRVEAPLLEGRGSVGLGYDRYSGDATPEAGETGAFSDLFGRNHRFLGFADLFTDPSFDTDGRGLQDLNFQVTWGLNDDLDLRVDYHRFLLADDEGLDDGGLADELDLTLSGALMPGLTLLGGGAWVGADDNAVALGLTPGDQLFGYLQLKVEF